MNIFSSRQAMMKPIPISLAVLAFTLLTNVAQAQNAISYAFTAFDVPFAGGSNTKAFDITPGGVIVGRFFDANFGGNPRGFLRYADGSFAPPIDVPVANTGTVARGVDMAGKWFDTGGGTHGFFRSAGGVFLLFDVTLPGAISGTTIANSLSNNGVIVGEYTAPTSISICTVLVPSSHGFMRNADGSFTAIDVPGAIATSARGIDDSGNIVGTYVTIPASASCSPSAVINAHGFLRDPQGNYTTLDFPGATNTLLFRIGDSGDITGLYTAATGTIEMLSDNIPPTLPVISFVSLQNGTFTSLNIPYPNPSTRGINPSGDVVGVYTDAQGDHGFLGSR
jgi:hypothetical protein